MAKLDISILKDLLEQAKSELKNFKKGEEFKLKDLFFDGDWEQIKNQNLHSKLGEKFSEYVQEKGATEVKFKEASKNNNSHIYI